MRNAACEFRFERGMTQPHLRMSHWEWDPPPSITAVIYWGTDAKIDMPIACLRIFPRVFVRNAARYTGVGIGGVYVSTQFRGQGYAVRLLSDSLKRVRQEIGVGSDYGEGDVEPIIAGLFSVDRNLYSVVGFEKVARWESEYLWVVPLRPDVRVGPGRWEIYPEGHF